MHFCQLLDEFPLHDLLHIRHQHLLFMIVHVDDLLQIFFFFLLIRIKGQVEDELEDVDELLSVAGLDQENLFDPLLLLLAVVVDNHLRDGFVVTLS